MASEAPSPGACDCHVHIFGPAARFPFAAGRAYTPPEAPLRIYRSVMEGLGLRRVVLVQPSVYGIDNRALLDPLFDWIADENLRRRILVDNPARLYGFA